MKNIFTLVILIFFYQNASAVLPNESRFINAYSSIKKPKKEMIDAVTVFEALNGEPQEAQRLNFDPSEAQLKKLGDKEAEYTNALKAFRVKIEDEYYPTVNFMLPTNAPIPDTGLGDLKASTGNGVASFNVNLVRYNLYLGDNVPIPLYLFAGRSVKSTVDKDTVSAALLDREAGILNLKFAKDIYAIKEGSSTGLCGFTSRRGGCWIHYDVGVKAYEVIEDPSASDGTEFDYSFYAAIGLSTEFPITQASTSELAGRMIFNIDVAYINSDSEKYASLFMTDPTDEPDLDDNIGVVDTRFTFTITDQFTIEAGGVLYSSSDDLDEHTFVNVSYDFE